MNRLVVSVAAAALAVLAAACTDFATPAELTKATILAVAADPPVVAPGASAALTTIVVDADGVITGLTPRHSLVETYPGVPVMGTLTVDGDVTRYVAPDPVPTLPNDAPPLDTVQIDVDTPDGPLRAIKVMAVLPLSVANPAITSLTVNGTDALAGPVTLARNAAVMLDVVSDPPASEDARFAWYSSAGGIEKYQSNPTELVASEDADRGWLFVVVRDGQGGVAWRGVEVVVE